LDENSRRALEEWLVEREKRSDQRLDEREYSSGILKSSRHFGDGENFYLLGFEAALHARNCCKELGQIVSKMASDLEELQRQVSPAAVEEPSAQRISASTGIVPEPVQRIQLGMTRPKR
jgi:hypothetical protein